MNILKSINEARRTLMHSLTKHIGNSRVDQNHLGANVQINRVLICRPNHRLGNQLLVTPLLQEVIATFPNCKIDLLVKGSIGPTLFRHYENIDHIIQLPKKPFKHLLPYIQGWMSIKKNHYDIVINAVKNSSSGRLSARFANATFKFLGDEDADILKYKDHEHVAKNVVYNFRHYLTKLGFAKSDKPIAPLDLKLSPSEIAEGRQILKKLVNNDKKTISLYTYATGEKCYSESWWATFYERLKIEYPDYNIIEVLPVENVSKIAFKAPAFYSKDLREIGSLIANTVLFIGADSGIMHLASAALTPTVGLFSITNADAYQPYDNHSVGINTNETNTEECIKILNGILRKN